MSDLPSWVVALATIVLAVVAARALAAADKQAKASSEMAAAATAQAQASDRAAVAANVSIVESRREAILAAIPFLKMHRPNVGFTGDDQDNVTDFIFMRVENLGPGPALEVGM